MVSTVLLKKNYINMSENVIVFKNSNGKKVPLITEQFDDEIIFTKKRDARPEEEKSKVIIYRIDSKRLQDFKKIEIDHNDKYITKLKKILRILRSSFENKKKNSVISD